MHNRADLNFGEAIYISIIFHIPASWFFFLMALVSLSNLDGNVDSNFNKTIFLCVTCENLNAQWQSLSPQNLMRRRKKELIHIESSSNMRTNTLCRDYFHRVANYCATVLKWYPLKRNHFYIEIVSDVSEATV